MTTLSSFPSIFSVSLLADTGYKQQPESKGRLLISNRPFPKRDFQQYDVLESANRETEKIEGKLLRVVMIQPSTWFIPVLEKRAERANLLVLPPFPALVDHDRSIARTHGSTKMESMQQQPASSK